MTGKRKRADVGSMAWSTSQAGTVTRSTGATSWLEPAHQTLVRSARGSPLGCRVLRDGGFLGSWMLPAFPSLPQGAVTSRGNARSFLDSGSG